MNSVTKLKIDSIEDEKPVNLNVKLPAGVHRNLVAYADALKRETGKTVDSTSLIAAMLARFMATDRAFARARRKQLQEEKVSARPKS
jgi:hypothetical protein